MRFGLIVAVGVATLVLAGVSALPIGQTLRGAATSTRVDVQLPLLGGESILYDRYGNPLQSINREYQVTVPLSRVPPTVIESILAVEDSDFYRHGPVDAKAIVRALQTNVRAGGVDQGGSTITQQVVKNSFTGAERTLTRKLREAFLSTRLEAELTKDQILERYLNIVYLGNNAYGVQAAAQTYWGKDVGQLTWSEGALLAGLIRDPNDTDPLRHPEAARKQRSLALRRLVETGRITTDQADAAEKEPLPTTLARSTPVRDYFVQEVIDRILERQGPTPEGDALGSTYEQRYDALYRGGLRIYTTYDPIAQNTAVEARQATVPTIRPDGTFPLPDWVDPATGKAYPQWGTASIVTVEARSGAVRVLVGGPGYSETSQVNIATKQPAPKQPGSSFKTFVLTAAIEMGYVPNDMVNGSSPCPITPDDPRFVNPAQAAKSTDAAPFAPHNFGGEGGGMATLTVQTTTSSNCAFARLGQIVSLRNVIDMAKAMGLTNCVTMDPAPTGDARYCMNPWRIPLAYGGTMGTSPLDMADAYATLANDGIHNDAYFIDRIEDAAGHVVWRHEPAPKRVMKPQTARLVTSVLEANVRGGTGGRAQLSSGQPAAGKTGTTDYAKNIWFVGYTPQYATAVWIGSGGTVEQPLFGGSATGGEYAAYTWGWYMARLLANQPIVDFTAPEPTRRGIAISIGPGDGSPFQAPVNLAANPAAPGAPGEPGAADDAGQADAAGPGGGNAPAAGGQPGAPGTSVAPPITSYPLTPN